MYKKNMNIIRRTKKPTKNGKCIRNLYLSKYGTHVSQNQQVAPLSFVPSSKNKKQPMKNCSFLTTNTTTTTTS
jgi:hypothetical protein